MSARPEIYRKINFIANRLNGDTYRAQMKGRTKPLKCFYPCPKAILLTAALSDENTLLYPTLERAALVICECHHGLDAGGMMDILKQMPDL